MKIAHRFSISTVALLVGLGTMPALAQEAGSNVVVTDTSSTSTNTAPVTNAPNTTADSGTSAVTQGNLNAENNIEQGLKSGSLTPEEAARLQAHQARIDQIESRDLSDGALTTNEQNRIDNAENREDNHITALDDNKVTADPTSQASTRMERDVQRNVNQQNHIVQGVTNGQLTNTEVSGLENGQARASGVESRFGRDGSISANEQSRLRSIDNNQRNQIRDDVHNDVMAESQNSQNTDNTGNGFNRHDNDNKFNRGDNDQDRDQDRFRTVENFQRDDNDHGHIIQTSTQGTLNGSAAQNTVGTSDTTNIGANTANAPNVEAGTTGNAQTSTTTPVNTSSTATVAGSTAAHTAPATPHITHMGGHH